MNEPLTRLDFWTAIRQRPALFLGKKTLSGLYYLLSGWTMAINCHRIVDDSFSLPYDFHDWVAYRLGFYESTSGWRNMILEKCPNEGEALDIFFGLRDDYYSRKPVEIAISVSGRLTLISYTLDPGFFCGLIPDPDNLRANRMSYFASIDSFEILYHRAESDLVITDPIRYAQVVRRRWSMQLEGQK